jgi:hypothetical protein
MFVRQPRPQAAVSCRVAGNVVMTASLMEQPRRAASDALLVLGELSSATSGLLTVALRAAASELRGTGLLVPASTEREQAPTASSGTAACPGVATLLLNARSCRSGCQLASTSGAPGGCSGVALAMRPMLVARWSSDPAGEHSVPGLLPSGFSAPRVRGRRPDQARWQGSGSPSMR